MKIGIIGAMENEVRDLVAHLSQESIICRSHLEFHEGTLEGVPVVVVKSGIGKVSMAACAQQLVDLFGVDCLINTGVAGALGDQIEVGDVVVSTRVVHHDADVTALGYPIGTMPGYPTYFEADPQLVEAFLSAVAEVAPSVHVYSGTVASGERFVASVEDRKRIHELFDGLCAEMEGAALAQVAWLNDIPFVVLRAMSDKADGSGAESYQAFEDGAASTMAHALMAALPTIAAQR
ncbi:5'-methylthioadenosine/adenosylhomocysteine nucleosidase [Muricaecibacterium torontonense]|uniref:adenosylhomocysteine nucleosidase n=1 Tax=Muricaecibacterium torontonense TaxID=3032871 RepID=A0A4S2F375_9ACTN|nr:5'-methylthioadenosine/adenosylhomocysteine nucleosidase [Muricaecibacterium torontonense]TGY61654.1 5'-methylthioadenosine/adenosylhomocysteine nucleosidase [Muricaecibacterium torontonense]